ncbi:MAG: iron uptake system component EfeO, partial [Mycobacterium sp.]|nr:iron uptake system component EfeO [Mycobacterium sp.]
MNRLFAWSVPVVALGLIVSGCSSDRSTSTESSSSSAPAMTGSAPAVDSAVLDKAATDYQGY